jgi:hypothetical protein
MNGLFETLETRRFLSATVTPIAITPIDPVAPIVIASPGKPLPISAEATDPFTGGVATLPGTIASNLLSLHGNISWGDGKSSQAWFVRAKDGSITVEGSHTWAKAGKYKVVALLSQSPVGKPGQPLPQYIRLLGSITTTATVTADEDGGVKLIEPSDTKFTAKLGSFDFRAIDVIIKSVKIDWGDGTTSLGTLKGSLLTGGEYSVFGTHTYTKIATYKVHIVVTTELAGSNKITGTAADFYSTIEVLPKV